MRRLTFVALLSMLFVGGIALAIQPDESAEHGYDRPSFSNDAIVLVVQSM